MERTVGFASSDFEMWCRKSKIVDEFSTGNRDIIDLVEQSRRLQHCQTVCLVPYDLPEASGSQNLFENPIAVDLNRITQVVW